MDAELVGESRVGGVLDVVLGGIEAVVRVGEIVKVAAAEVVGDVAAAVIVMGVVDEAVHLAVQQSAGVDQLKLRQASAQRPGGQTELVAVVLGRKLGGYILGDIGLGDERPLGLERLRRVLHQQTPIVVDVVGEADTRAAVGGLVPVVLHQAFVAGALHRIGAGHLGTEGGDFVAVHHLAAGREHRGDVVDQPQVARLGTRTEQRALGSGEHLDALHVHGVDIEVAGAEGDRLLVHVQRHAGCGPLGSRHRHAGLLGRGDDDFLDLGVGNACGGAG